jgi:hypothetical protein
VSLVLGACGGGGGGGSAGGLNPPPSSGADFIPLGQGDTWVYRRDDGVFERSRVSGTQVIDGQTLVVVTDTDLGTGTVVNSALRKSASAVTEVPDGSDPFLAALGAVDDLHLPLRVGDSYVQVDRILATGFDVDGDNIADPLQVRSTVSVLATEAVTVPAGTFAAAMKVRTRIVESAVGSATGRAITFTITADEWYAADIGVVRSRIETTVTGVTTVQTRELQSWRVGSRSSDAAPPQISAITPAPGATTGRTVVVVLDTDEPLDAFALSPQALRLAGASTGTTGVAIGRVTGSRVQFNLPAPLPADTYTLTLDNSLQDLLGNRIAARSWTLVVDGAGPALLSTVPAANAAQVTLTSAVDLQFSEAVDLDSVLQSVELGLVGSVERVPVTLQALNASTVRLLPTVALQPQTDYVVRLSGTVRDLNGNSTGTPSNVPFRTGDGLFRFPLVQVNSFVNASAMAAGDVSGDGRADLLSIPPSADALEVRRQLPDGTLDVAYRVALNHNGCSPDTIQIADLNGDGRLDVVVAERGCGLDLLLQNAAGVLEPGPFLPGVNSRVVRAADLNADGRVDLVGIGSGTDVSLWLQGSDGSWGTPTQVPLAHIGTLGLAVGDINGDGRPDIVVASGGAGPPGKGLGLLLQRADGGFDAGGYLDVDPVWGAWGVAIGDLDGDGRADIVSGFLGAGLGLFRQGADGRLQPMQVLPGFDTVRYLQVVDLDGDGRRDLLAYQQGRIPLVVALQRPDGSLQRAQQLENELYPTDGPDRLAVADLNGDGRLDVVIPGPRVMYATAQAAAPAGLMPLQRHPVRILQATQVRR